MRLFVALNLPAAERRRILESTRRLREGGFPVRWVGPEQLHVTLKFLGEVAEGRAAEIVHAVSGAARRARPFDLKLSGVGGFPRLANPRVVWLGIEVVPELETLYAELEDRFEALGFERETRPFHPHLTLGRAQRGARAAQLRGLDGVAGTVEYRGTVRAETLDLMQSRLRPSGAEYEVRHPAPLGATRGGEERRESGT